MFKNNDAVSFGDINLSQQSIRGDHNPGAGGWPTVRYFNKETGYGGAAYEKKTSKPMCEELGDEKYMSEYVMEQGKTSLCSIAEGNAGCGEREIGFIAKWASKGREAVEAQVARLSKLAGGKMKPELAQWVNQRLAILRQYAAKEEL